MRTRPAAAVAFAAALLLALAGCVPTTAHPSSSASASATPVFASDAEALAAAEKAYAAYLRVSDEILIDGGSHPERLKAFTSSKLYDEELKGFRLTAKNRWHSTGGTTYDHFSLQAYDPEDPNSLIVAYVCSDVSHVDVLDSNGSSVVSVDRPDRTPFEVTFALRGSGTVVLASNDVWPGAGVC